MSNPPTIHPAAPAPAALGNVSILPSTLADYDNIAASMARVGMPMVSRAEYQHRWTTNPFQPRDQQGKTGWLMQTDAGRVVGWFGNIFSGYEMDGRRLLAASTHAVYVEEEYRNRSLPLIAQFFRQPGVDLLQVTTANEQAGKVWTAMKMRPVPHPSYDHVLYWVLNPSRFMAAGLRRKKAPLAGPAGLVLGAGLRASNALSGHQAPARVPRGAPEPRIIEDFDDQFDGFWNHLRHRPGKLLAVRSHAALAWHFHDARVTNRLAIVIVEDHDGLAGYAILVRRDADEIGLRRFGIGDLQIKREDPDLVRALMVGAMRATREQDVDVLEVTGFEPFKRGVIELMRPRVRQSPSWPFMYKAQSVALATALESAAAWDPCPYDGDAAF